MHVNALRLKNFRNYQDEYIEFDKSVNVIYGENGHGKTNILEAIFMCSCAKSHRSSKDNDLVRFGTDGYHIYLGVYKENRHKNIEMHSIKKHRRSISINEIPLKKTGELMGNLRVVMFSPEDILSVKEGPSIRRRMIDISLSQSRPSYFYELQQYNKTLFQRNTLLKGNNTKEIFKTLDVWDKSLASHGAKIIIERRKYIKLLSVYAIKRHKSVTMDKEELSIKYISSININDEDEIKEIEYKFVQMLEKQREREIKTGMTLCGPQRDDLELMINDNEIKQYGSQGQQRTAMLSIKMAETDMIRDDTDDIPVLLLDDVMSELDEGRRRYLVENINDMQTFITTTDRELFTQIPSKKTAFYMVTEGKVTNKSNFV